jgi:hypothetical protein
MNHSLYYTKSHRALFGGLSSAPNRIRTCTWKSIQRPERCASANSATGAIYLINYLIKQHVLLYINFQ